MFGSSGQQRQHGGFRVPAPRPPRAPQPATAPTAPVADESPGGFSIREDTQFVSVPFGGGGEAGAGATGSPAESPGGFCVRDDTQVITVADEQGDASPAPAPSPGGFGGGFSIREDTQYITVPVRREQEGGVGEDEAAEEAAALLSSAPAPAAGGGFSLSIREDAQFNAPGGTGVPSPGFSPASSGGMGSDSGSLLPRKRPLGECNASPVLGAGAGQVCTAVGALLLGAVHARHAGSARSASLHPSAPMHCRSTSGALPPALTTRSCCSWAWSAATTR